MYQWGLTIYGCKITFIWVKDNDVAKQWTNVKFDFIWVEDNVVSVLTCTINNRKVISKIKRYQ
jgi:hypothetical protein